MNKHVGRWAVSRLAPSRAGRWAAALATVTAFGALAGAGCEAYDGAPYGVIAGSEKGILADRKLPLIVAFDKAVKLETVKLKVARLVVDAEGLLGDEDADDETTLDVLLDFDGANPDDAVGGWVEQSADGKRLTITPATSFPVVEKLVVLLEPGLSGVTGPAYVERERLPFSYDVKLTCSPAPDFVSGAYYFLADVKQPIGVQVQLQSWIDVDPATGKFVGLFVNADRDRDPARCTEYGLSCNPEEQACRTLPEPACVAPSEKAASVDEYPDYLPNYDLPVGYSFTVHGCVDGSGEKIVFVNFPVDVEVQSPHVILISTILTASFAKDADGVLRGAGSITADHVLLGTADSGKAEGLVSARLIPAGEEPKGLQKPTEAP